MADLVAIAEPDGERKLNAVFVHGLGGDAWGTWTYGGLEENFWPRHLATVVPGLAVYSLNYDASPLAWLGKAMSIPDRAANILSRLLAAIQFGIAPIVFICHSLGGLLVKQALLDAKEQQRPGSREERFLDRVRGIVFLSTPHTGSDLATLLKAIGFIARTNIVVEDLGRNNLHLLHLRQRYQTWSHDHGMRHLVFVETHKAKNIALVVERDSGDPVFPDAWAIPIDADHFSICKPIGDQADVFVRTVDFVNEIIAAPVRNSPDDAAAKARIEQAVELARAKGVDPRLLAPIFAALGQQGLSAEEMREQAREAIAKIVARSEEKVTPSNDGFDIDSTIAAARSKLRGVDTVGARALLDAKIAEESATSRQRLIPLLRERATIERLTFDYSAAKGSLAELLELDPGHGWALIELGEIERISGTARAAEAAFRAALAASRVKGDDHQAGVALERIGDVLASNDLVGALKHYNESLGISSALVKQDGSAERMRESWVRVIKIGDFFLAHGFRELAQDAYGLGKIIARALYEQDRSNAERKRDLYVSMDKFLNAFHATIDVIGPLKDSEESLNISRSLYEQDKSPERARDLLVCLNKVGDVLLARNIFADALPLYQESLEISRALQEQDKSMSRARNVLVCLTKVGDVFLARRDFEEALECYRESLKISRGLYERGTSPESARDLLVCLNKVGDVLLARNDLVGALNHYKQRVEIACALYQKDRSDAERARYASLCLNKVGDVLLARKDLVSALEFYQESLKISRTLYELDGKGVESARDVLADLNKVGDVLLAQNDPEGALQHYREGLEISRALYKQHKSHAGRLVDLSASLKKVASVLKVQNDLVGAFKHYNEIIRMQKALHDNVEMAQSQDLVRALDEQDRSRAERARDVLEI